MAFKGHNPWNKGKIGVYSEEALKRMSEAKKKNPVRYWLGKKRPHHSEETKRKMGKAHKGEKSHLWKGGISPKNKIIRGSIEFRLWREAVFQYDDYTCWICGDRSGKGHTVYLHPHHLKRFSDYPKLRFKVSNGLTLCRFCHKTYTKFGIARR